MNLLGTNIGRNFVCYMFCLAFLMFNCPDIFAEEWDLNQVLDIGLKQSPRLTGAREAVKGGEARVEQKFASYYPSLNLNSDYTRFKSASSRTAGPFAVSTGPSDLYTTSFDASQDIYDFGRRKYRVAASRYDVRGLQWDFRDVRLAVIDDLKEAYYGVLAVDRTVKVRQDDVTRRQEHLRQAETFLKVGTRPKIDVTQAQVDLIRARQALLQAQSDARVIRVTLLKAMGLETGPTFSLKDDLDIGRVNWQLEELKQATLANNPALNRLQASLDSAQALEEAARRDYWPALAGTASYGWSGSTHPSDPSWDVGLQLQIPLFSGFQTRGRVAEARAFAGQTKANLITQKLEILSSLESQFQGLVLADAQIAVSTEALRSAGENFELASGRYKAGVGTMLEVTDAQVSLIQAETDYIQALYNYKIARFRVERIVGRE